MIFTAPSSYLLSRARVRVLLRMVALRRDPLTSHPIVRTRTRLQLQQFRFRTACTRDEEYNRRRGRPLCIRPRRAREEVPYTSEKKFNFSDEPGWGRGGSLGCNAYGADRSKSPYGYNTIVSSTFPCTVRDYARLGYLWLKKGRWNKQQLIPEKWVKSATKRFI